jgi:hypothetical protein
VIERVVKEKAARVSAPLGIEAVPESALRTTRLICAIESIVNPRTK